MPLATCGGICWMNGQKMFSAYSGQAETLGIPLKKIYSVVRKHPKPTHTYTHTHKEADGLKAENFSIACMYIC